jgi:NAD(P)-dependent dehydrogenase (short-subunit alcohol dehydrogenase family)
MASPSQVAELAGRVRERLGRSARLDVLVHAAGFIYHRYEASPEGTERTAAVHVAGTHLLTKRLLPLLKAAAPSAVIWVSSGGMYAQRLDLALLGPDPASYNGLRAYALAKRAQSVLAQLWSEHHGADGVLFRVMHPGWVETRAIEAGLPGFARLARPLLRTPEQGADTIVGLATGAACHNPQVGLWFDRRPRGEHRLPGTKTSPGEAAKLWDWCEERANASGPGPLPLSGRPL